MRLQTILVGVDFSEHSEVALAQACALARRHESKIVLVHGTGVSDTGMYQYEVSGWADEPWKRYVKERMERAREQLAAAATTLRGDGFAVAEKLVAGFGDDAITTAAREVEADLVVVGTHGRTGVDHFLIGSVAERVVRLTETSVLVARPDSEAPPRRVLVPTDFSDRSAKGMALALSIAGSGAYIEVLHCWRPSDDAALPEWMRRDIAGDAQKRGDGMVLSHAGQDVTITFGLSETTPSVGIQQRLSEGGIDAVVMGSHGRRGLRRMLLGSVAEKTVRHSPVSVYVAHGQ